MTTAGAIVTHAGATHVGTIVTHVVDMNVMLSQFNVNVDETQRHREAIASPCEEFVPTAVTSRNIRTSRLGAEEATYYGISEPEVALRLTWQQRARDPSEACPAGE